MTPNEGSLFSQKVLVMEDAIRVLNLTILILKLIVLISEFVR